jgi:hypothetical protein
LPDHQLHILNSRYRRRRMRYRAIAMAGIAIISIAESVRADTTATWNNVMGGLWTTASNWNTNPNYPNNNTPAGTDYQVNIDLASSSAYGVGLSGSVTVDGLNINSSNATLVVDPGAFLGLTSATIQAGQMNEIDAELSGGSAGATLTVDAGATFQLFGGDLDHLTFAGADLSEGTTYALSITNGLSLSGHTLDVTGSYMSEVSFLGSPQTIDNLTIDSTALPDPKFGPASLVIGSAANFSTSSLTLGTHATLDGTAFLGQGIFGSTLVNNGTINANMSGEPFSIFVSNVTNNSVLMASSGGYLNIDPSSLTNNGSVQIAGAGSTGSIHSFSGTGTITVGDGATSSSLQMATGSGLGRLSALTIESGSYFDLTNNGLLITYGSGPDPASTIRGYLKSGYNGGAWNGLGLNSSAAAANPGYALAYADGADGVVKGVSAGQVFIAYTLYGDANIDGVVNGDDFTILIGNLHKSVSSWDQGDFNYDGVVSGDDFTLLVGNLGKKANTAAVAIPSSDYAAIDAFAAANGLLADVPEPGCITLLLVGGLGLGTLRRRSSAGRR